MLYCCCWHNRNEVDLLLYYLLSLDCSVYNVLSMKTRELSTSFHPDSNQIRALHLAHQLDTSLSFECQIINKLIQKLLYFAATPSQPGLLTQHSSHCSRFDFLNFLSRGQIKLLSAALLIHLLVHSAYKLYSTGTFY